jgi:multiple sugar transport system substrate-binding protein
MNSPLLKGITWDHPRGYDPLIASSALYEKLFGIKVKWEKRWLSRFGDQSLAGLSETFDLLIIDHPHIGVAFETNCLFPVNKLLTKEKINVLKGQTAGLSFPAYTYKGKQWAIPIDAAMQCSATRPDLLQDLAVPKNWSEVFQFTDVLKEKNLQVGMALCSTDSLCSFLTITAQLGSPVIEGNQMLVTRETGLQSLELMRRMRDNFHVNSLNWNPIQLYDYMSTHDDIAYTPLAFCYSNYSRDGFRRNKLSYGNAPGSKNAVLGGAGIAVSAKSNYVKEAAQYAAWICTAEIQSSVYVLEQGQPANIVAWKSDVANKLTNNFFFNTFDTLENAFVRPRYGGWPEFQKYLGEVLHHHLKNDTDPVKVLDHLQEMYRLSYKNKHG